MAGSVKATVTRASWRDRRGRGWARATAVSVTPSEKARSARSRVGSCAPGRGCEPSGPKVAPRRGTKSTHKRHSGWRAGELVAWMGASWSAPERGCEPSWKRVKRRFISRYEGDTPIYGRHLPYGGREARGARSAMSLETHPRCRSSPSYDDARAITALGAERRRPGPCSAAF